MCLKVDRIATEKFIRTAPDRVVAWKVVLKDVFGVKTPYMRVAVKGGWFKAKGKRHPDDTRLIFHGAIHCYQTKKVTQSALKISRMIGETVHILRCEALKKDMIAVGDGDICFSKIWIPKSELERIK